MESKTANGEVGYLIWCGGDRYVFRQYDANHDFKDYDIRHCDMRIKIIDADAHFYEDNGKLTLDHSPATLGIKQMGMFDWIEWEGNRYQTKDTPNQMCDNYRISGCGELFVEEYDAELVKDPEHIFGVYMEQKNQRWRECREFTGQIRFYKEDPDRGGYKNHAWIEWQAEFKCGLMIDLKMLEGDRFLEWYQAGIEQRGLG